MPNDAIYLVSDSGELKRVEYQLYATENVLQELIAKHPDLLAGDQIDPASPPRWLLLRQEAAIPDREDGEDRWWLDHLLLDQFGVPTLVEVKRSTDTRIRREVIGQMLDYVANAQAYWAAGRMRQMLNDETGSSEAADARLAEHLGIADPETAKPLEEFWLKVEANLREGNVRLLFVADELPRELKKLIEFLNEHFTKIEVLGVELRQYVGQGIKALVPRVVGQTEAAREQKERSSPTVRSATVSTPWTTREDFLGACNAGAGPFFADLLKVSEKRGLQISWGTKGFSIRARGRPPFFYCFPNGTNGRPTDDIEIFLRDLKEPEIIEKMRSEFLKIPSARPVGTYTIRYTVAADNLANAQRVFDKSADFMASQEPPESESKSH